MPPAEFGVSGYRRWTRYLTIVSLGLTVLAFYLFLKGQGVWGLASLVAGVAALFLVQRVLIRPEPGSEHQLVFVTKEECSLCDEARLLLPTILASTPFRVDEKKIEADRFLRRHFKDRVPVLLWQGGVVAELRFDPGTVRVSLEEIQKGLARSPAPAEESP